MHRSMSRSTPYLPRYQSVSPARSPHLRSRRFPSSPRSTSQPRERIVYIDNAPSRVINSYHVHHSPSPNRTYTIHVFSNKTNNHLTRVTRSRSACDINSSHVYTSHEDISVGSLKETASRQVGSSEDIYHAVPFFPDVTPSESGVSFGDWEEGSTFGGEDDNVSQHSFGSSSAFCEKTVDSELDKCDSDNFSGPDYTGDRALGILHENYLITNTAIKKRKSRRSSDGLENRDYKIVGHVSETKPRKGEIGSSKSLDFNKFQTRSEALSVLIPESEISGKMNGDLDKAGIRRSVSTPLAHSTPHVSPGGSGESKLSIMSSWDAGAIDEAINGTDPQKPTPSGTLSSQGSDTRNSSRFEDSSYNSSCSEDNYSDVSNVTTSSSPVTRKIKLVKKHSDKPVSSKKSFQPDVFHQSDIAQDRITESENNQQQSNSAADKVKQRRHARSLYLSDDTEVPQDQQKLTTDTSERGEQADTHTAGDEWWASYGSITTAGQKSPVVSGDEDTEKSLAFRRGPKATKPLATSMPLISPGKHGQEKLRKLSQMSPPRVSSPTGSPPLSLNENPIFGENEENLAEHLAGRQVEEGRHVGGFVTSENTQNHQRSDSEVEDSDKQLVSTILHQTLSKTSSDAAKNDSSILSEVELPTKREILDLEQHSGILPPAEEHVHDSQQKVVRDSKQTVVHDAQQEVMHDIQQKVVHDSQQITVHDAQQIVVHDAQQKVMHDIQQEVVHDTQQKVVHDSQQKVNENTRALSHVVENEGTISESKEDTEIIKIERDNFTPQTVTVSRESENSNTANIQISNGASVVNGHSLGVSEEMSGTCDLTPVEREDNHQQITTRSTVQVEKESTPGVPLITHVSEQMEGIDQLKHSSLLNIETTANQEEFISKQGLLDIHENLVHVEENEVGKEGTNILENVNEELCDICDLTPVVSKDNHQHITTQSAIQEDKENTREAAVITHVSEQIEGIDQLKHSSLLDIGDPDSQEEFISKLSILGIRENVIHVEENKEGKDRTNILVYKVDSTLTPSTESIVCQELCNGESSSDHGNVIHVVENEEGKNIFERKGDNTLTPNSESIVSQELCNEEASPGYDALSENVDGALLAKNSYELDYSESNSCSEIKGIVLSNIVPDTGVTVVASESTVRQDHQFSDDIVTLSTVKTSAVVENEHFGKSQTCSVDTYTMGNTIVCQETPQVVLHDDLSQLFVDIVKPSIPDPDQSPDTTLKSGNSLTTSCSDDDSQEVNSNTEYKSSTNTLILNSVEQQFIHTSDDCTFEAGNNNSTTSESIHIESTEEKNPETYFVESTDRQHEVVEGDEKGCIDYTDNTLNFADKQEAVYSLSHDETAVVASDITSQDLESSTCVATPTVYNNSVGVQSVTDISIAEISTAGSQEAVTVTGKKEFIIADKEEFITTDKAEFIVKDKEKFVTPTGKNELITTDKEGFVKRSKEEFITTSKELQPTTDEEIFLATDKEISTTPDKQTAPTASDVSTTTSKEIFTATNKETFSTKDKVTVTNKEAFTTTDEETFGVIHQATFLTTDDSTSVTPDAFSSGISKEQTINTDTSVGTCLAVSSTATSQKSASEIIYGLSHPAVAEQVTTPQSSLATSCLDIETSSAPPAYSICISCLSAETSCQSDHLLTSECGQEIVPKSGIDFSYEVSLPGTSVSQPESGEAFDSTAHTLEATMYPNSPLEKLQAQLSLLSGDSGLNVHVDRNPREDRTETLDNFCSIEHASTHVLTDFSKEKCEIIGDEYSLDHTNGDVILRDELDNSIQTNVNSSAGSQAVKEYFDSDYDNVTTREPAEPQLYTRPHNLHLLQFAHTKTSNLWALQEETESAMNTPSPKQPRITFVNEEESSNLHPHHSAQIIQHNSTEQNVQDDQIKRLLNGQKLPVSVSPIVEMDKENGTADSNSVQFKSKSKDTLIQSEATTVGMPYDAGKLDVSESDKSIISLSSPVHRQTPEIMSGVFRAELVNISSPAVENTQVNSNIDEEKNRVLFLGTFRSNEDLSTNSPTGKATVSPVSSLDALSASLKQFDRTDITNADSKQVPFSSDSPSAPDSGNYDSSPVRTFEIERNSDEEINKASSYLPTNTLDLSDASTSITETETNSDALYTCTGTAEIKKTPLNVNPVPTSQTNFKPDFTKTVANHKLTNTKIKQFEKILYEFNKGLRTSQDITDFLFFCENYTDYTDSSTSSSDDLYKHFTNDDSEKVQNHTCITLEDEDMNTFRFKRYLKKSHAKRNNGRKILRFLSKLSCVSETLSSPIDKPNGKVKNADKDACIFSTDSMTNSKMRISNPVLISSTSFQLHNILNSSPMRYDNNGNTSFDSLRTSADSAYSSLSDPTSGSLSSPAFRHTPGPESVSSVFSLDITTGDWTLPDNVFSNTSDATIRTCFAKGTKNQPSVQERDNLFSLSDEYHHFNFSENEIDGALLNKLRYGHVQAKLN